MGKTSPIYPGHEALYDDPLGKVVELHAPGFVGTNAQRLAFSTVGLTVSKFWFESDTGNLYQFSGTNWNQVLSVIGTQTPGNILVINSSGIAVWKPVSGPVNISPSGATSIGNLLTLAYEQPNNTNGGSSTINAWTIYPLNTILQNDLNIASISSNTFILPAGTYSVTNSSFFLGNAGNGQMRLKNLTDSTVPLLGNVGYSGVGGGNGSNSAYSIVSGQKFTITTAKTFQLEYYVTSNFNNSDLGIAVSVGNGEVGIFGYISIQKVA